MDNAKIYINGEWVHSVNNEKFDVFNPATGEIVGTVPKAGEKETIMSIDAANNAFNEWSSLPASRRAEYLRRWYELIILNKAEIAKIMTQEQGKPFNEALAEVYYAANYVEWYSEEAKRVYGETIPTWDKDKRIMIIKQPVGVVAAITPWNFPAAMATRKLAPALAAGCTVILKPASQTPLTSIKLVELLHQAGFPRGTVNILTGSAKKIGKAIIEDPRVRKITFTGSTEVGKSLMKDSANTLKRISLELGGLAPFIVFDDANVEKAVEGAIAAKLRNCGQVCVAPNRFFVQEGIEDEFIKILSKKMKEQKVGNGLQEGVTIGPLIDKDGFKKVEHHVKDALNKGAELAFGGNNFKSGNAEDAGYFYEPTIIRNVDNTMLIMNEETFGPIIAIQTFKTDEEAISIANDTSFGLASYIFTESLSRGIKISEKLEVGIVGLNDGKPSAVQAPFGGFKESGMGREGGRHGIDTFLEIKYISIGI